MMKIIFRVSILFFLFFPGEVFAQLSIVDNISANTLVKNVLSGDAGIEIRNISYKGYDRSLALFENGNSTGLGIDKGIVLSSGLAVGARGPNSIGTYTSGAGGPGSQLLNKYAGTSTIDAAELQFDFKPQASQVVFNYVFSSEEYIEWVNKGFSDIFGFFVEGPGITGEMNVALVPGTGLPVSIDNINHIKNSGYFKTNSIPGSITYKFLQHDAQTTVLQARLNLIPCEWYTIKLSIADVGDNNWDSWVFIEAQSFKHETSVGKDTFYCDPGFNKTLNAGYPGRRVLWSTSDTTQSIEVHDYGTYWVEIFTDCGSFRDYITIKPAILPFNLGNDTTYCGAIPDHKIRVPGPVFEKYRWSNGDTTAITTVNQPGVYSVTVSRYGCEESDTIQIGLNPLPDINLGADTVLCSGASVSVLAGSSTYSYLWNDGSTDASRIFNQNGTWFVRAESLGCYNTDTIHIAVREDFTFDLGPKQMVKCSRDLTVLDTRLRDTGFVFKWNNGHNGPYLITDLGGLYFVDVKDAHCDYWHTDSLLLIQYEGGAQYFMPNAFSPNTDEFNPTFGPVHALHSLKSYKLLIYNRWGELVFKSETPGERWDGTFNGFPADAGVYVYICEIRSNCLPDNEQFKRGSFHLMR